MKKILEKDLFLRMLKRLAHEIMEANLDLSNLILCGIEKKGVPIAYYLRDLIYKFEDISVPVETINIISHRDDDKKNTDVKTILKTDINNKTVILVDDVLYTCRSIRAAMDLLLDYGRPKKIMLCVLIDRGHKELPIKANFVGKNIPTQVNEKIYCDFTNKEIFIY